MTNWFVSLLRDLRDTFIEGPKLFRLVPLIPLLAILPELVQHYVEIDLGMFASKAAFKAHSMDPIRWSFGYFKLAGYLAAILSAAFYWGSRKRPRWSISLAQLGRFMLALALNVGLALVQWPLKDHLTDTANQVLFWGASIMGIPLLIYLIGTLFDDPAMTLKRAFSHGWLRLIGLILCAGSAVALGQAVHRLNHTLALGAPTPIVFALMLWDGIWVGLMACWIGTGLAFGYGREPGSLTKS